MFVTSLDHDNLILKSYYKYHRASSYMCHQLGVFISNVPEDRKVFPKQRTCLKDHLPRLEHFASTQLCNCEAQKLSWKIWLWLLQDAFGSLIILALQSRQLRWIFSFDEVCHLRCALANTKFSKPNDFVYWIHQINLYWSSTCPNISSSPCQVVSTLITLQNAAKVVT